MSPMLVCVCCLGGIVSISMQMKAGGWARRAGRASS